MHVCEPTASHKSFNARLLSRNVASENDHQGLLSRFSKLRFPHLVHVTYC